MIVEPNQNGEDPPEKVLVEIEKKATEELRAAETGLDICVVTIIDHH